MKLCKSIHVVAERQNQLLLLGCFRTPRDSPGGSPSLKMSPKTVEMIVRVAVCHFRMEAGVGMFALQIVWGGEGVP